MPDFSYELLHKESGLVFGLDEAGLGIAVPRDSDGHVAIHLEIDPCYALDAGQFKVRLAASGATPDASKDLLFS